MHLAAEFWAQARKSGQPAAHDQALDADMILAGQAAALGIQDFVIATTTTKHLAKFVPAEEWHTIQPDTSS